MYDFIGLTDLNVRADTDGCSDLDHVPDDRLPGPSKQLPACRLDDGFRDAGTAELVSRTA